MKRILILSGGTGEPAANRLRRVYDQHPIDIVVVDRDDSHGYLPGLLSILFGRTDTTFRTIAEVAEADIPW